MSIMDKIKKNLKANAHTIKTNIKKDMVRRAGERKEINVAVRKAKFTERKSQAVKRARTNIRSKGEGIKSQDMSDFLLGGNNNKKGKGKGFQWI